MEETATLLPAASCPGGDGLTTWKDVQVLADILKQASSFLTQDCILFLKWTTAFWPMKIRKFLGLPEFSFRDKVRLSSTR